MTKHIRAPRLLVLVAISALAALALATAGGVAAAPGGQGKGKAGAKGYKLSRGATTLTLEQSTVDALTAAGVALSVNQPATLVEDPLGVKFPVTQGRVKVSGGAASGKIGHAGGVTFTEGETTITLRNLRIVLDADPDLTALVSVNGATQGRLSIADLSGGDLSIETVGTKKHPRRWLNIDGVVVTLNAASLEALNGFFDVGLDPAVEYVLGEADVRTRIVGRFPA